MPYDKKADVYKKSMTLVNWTQTTSFVLSWTYDCDYWKSTTATYNEWQTARNEGKRLKEVDMVLGLDISIGDKMELSYAWKVDGMYQVIDEIPYPSFAWIDNTLYIVRSVDG